MNESHTELVLGYLQSGQILTDLKSYRLFGYLHLAQRVYDLRKRGYSISSKMITVTSGRMVKQYWM